MTGSNSSRLARGAGGALGGKLVGRSILFVGYAMFARMLGPEMFGLFAIAWTLHTTLTGIANLGLIHGVIRFVSEYRESAPERLGGIIRQSLLFSAVSGTTLGAVVFFSAEPVASHLFHKPELSPLLAWTGVSLGLATCFRVAASATRASEQVRYSVLSEELVQPATHVLLFLPVFYYVDRLTSPMIAATFSFAAGLALALYHLKRLFPEAFVPDGSAVAGGRELLRFSITSVVGGLAVNGILWADRLFLGYFMPAAEVGLYQSAAQLAFLFAVVLSGFASIYSPVVARLHSRGATDELEALYTAATKWALYAITPFLILLLCVPEQVMVFVFGKAYAGGAGILVVLSIGLYLSVPAGLAGLLLVMCRRHRTWAQLGLAMLAIDIVLNMTLIPRYGSIGAALATSVSLAGLYVFGTWRVRADVGLWPYNRRYLKGIVATAGSAGAVWVARAFLMDRMPGLVLVQGAIAFLTFGAVLSLVGLDEEERELVAMVRRRLERLRGTSRSGQV